MGQRIDDQEELPGHDRSTPQVLTSLVNNAAEMMRTEVRLARAEMADKADQARNGAVALLMGGGIALLSLIFIILGAIAALAEFTELGFWASSLIVGAIIGLVGFIMLRRGISKLKPRNLEPTRTEEALKSDVRLAKETMQ